MKVLVTGASGNVGTSVLDALAGATEVSEVLALARRPARLQFAKTTWLQGDIATTDLLSLFRGVDAVVHLAWLIQPSRNEKLTYSVNVAGSERVFDAVAQAGVPALVYASSVGAYAPGSPASPVDESWPTSGIDSSFYSRHKAQVEQMLDRFQERHPDVRVVRLRPALIFKAQAASEIRRLFMGPLLPTRLVRPERLPALPYPKGLRTQLVHSHDVGEAYRLAVTQPVHGPFNLAADPVLDAQLLEEALEARVARVPARIVRAAASLSWQLRLQPTSPGWLDLGMRSPLMDCTRARNELGWEARHSSTEALLELLEGLRRRTGMKTPPLDPASSGRFRWREFRSGVGASDI